MKEQILKQKEDKLKRDKEKINQELKKLKIQRETLKIQEIKERIHDIKQNEQIYHLLSFEDYINQPKIIAQPIQDDDSFWEDFDKWISNILDM